MKKKNNFISLVLDGRETKFEYEEYQLGETQ